MQNVDRLLGGVVPRSAVSAADHYVHTKVMVQLLGPGAWPIIDTVQRSTFLL